MQFGPESPRTSSILLEGTRTPAGQGRFHTLSVFKLSKTRGFHAFALSGALDLNQLRVRSARLLNNTSICTFNGSFVPKKYSRSVFGNVKAMETKFRGMVQGALQVTTQQSKSGKSRPFRDISNKNCIKILIWTATCDTDGPMLNRGLTTGIES